MGLRDLTFRDGTVQTSGGDLVVRGLSLEDVVPLVRQHGTALSTLFIEIAGDRDNALDNMQTLAGALAQAAPLAAAEIIALGAGEPGELDRADVATARRVPLPDQIAILERIGTLTFATEGSLKKALETVIRVARGMRAELQALQT